MIPALLACEEEVEDALEDAVLTEEQEDAKLAAPYEDLFLQTLARADEINERFIMRLQLLTDSAMMSPDFTMDQVIQETEIDYIWGELMSEPDIIQAQLTIGEQGGMGLDMKLFPDRLVRMEGAAFVTRFGSEEIAGGKGWASTEQTGTIPAIDIENDHTDRPNNAIVHLRMFIALPQD